MVERITHDGKLLSIIIPHNFRENGVHFFTSNELAQQVAYMRHPLGKHILPHTHNPVSREVTQTQEVLFIKSGKLRVDFYTENRTYLESRVLVAGDVILLICGGHGFEVLDDLEMIEVKQGPYSAETDKVRFPSVDKDKIRLSHHE